MPYRYRAISLYLLAGLSVFLFSHLANLSNPESPSPTAQTVVLPSPEAVLIDELPTATPSITFTISPTGTPAATPVSSIRLSLQFISQAPLGIWDALHEEACEEASLLMVNLYRTNNTLNLQEADKELIRLVAVEEGMGWGPSITLDQLARLAVQEYGMLSARVESVSMSKLKEELAAGRPIIIPAAGQALGNPHFKQPGPIYHMLVVIGYDQSTDEFITHDPGTRHGANYRYTASVLVDAIHDYDAGEEIYKGSVRYLVFD